jgi:ferredoxin
MKNAPEVFRVDERDVMHVLVERPAPEQMEKVRLAVRRCPRKALSLVEE